MGIFEKDLPVTLCPVADNPEGIKYQGRLKAVTKEHILVDTGNSVELGAGGELLVEFRAEDSQFRFSATVHNLSGATGLLLNKPKIIHRSKIREGPRVELPMMLNYTIWTEGGRFEAEVLDMSESGVRMRGAKNLRKGTLISLDFYMKDAKIRVICQGLVAWSRADEDIPAMTVSGVQFTTISNDARKKLARHLQQKNDEAAASGDEPT